MLKQVPKHIKINPYTDSMDIDPRWNFFQNPQIHTKYFYRINTDSLISLGNFLKMDQINPPRSNTFSGFLDFTLWFLNDGSVKTANIVDELYYSDNNDVPDYAEVNSVIMESQAEEEASRQASVNRANILAESLRLGRRKRRGGKTIVKSKKRKYNKQNKSRRKH